MANNINRFHNTDELNYDNNLYEETARTITH